MIELLELFAFDTPLAWLLLSVTGALILVIPKIFGLNVFNGLAYAQISLFFTSSTVIGGLSVGRVSFDRGVHFFAVEFIFLLATFAIYSYLLRKRALTMESLQKFFSGPNASLAIALVGIIALFNFYTVPTDGTSRIGFMTARWFSFVKPFIVIIYPLCYIGVFILIILKKRRMSMFLLLALVTANIFTGSKASFALLLLSAFLSVRDLSRNPRIRVGKIRFIDKVFLTAFVCGMVAFSLTRLEVSSKDIQNRLFLFGEANLLTYFSDRPTAACESVSTFAKMHRGLARLTGDRSATDIDTLFGFALTIEAYGENSFTGPNARLSAYMICNFPGISILLGIFVILIYFSLLLTVFWLSRGSRKTLAIIYPYCLTSVASASQDFNLIMQDLTFFTLLLIVITLLKISPKRDNNRCKRI